MRASEKINNKKKVNKRENITRNNNKTLKPHMRCRRIFAISVSLMLFKKSIKSNHEDFWSVPINGNWKNSFWRFSANLT